MDFFLFVSAIGKNTISKKQVEDKMAPGSCDDEGTISFRSQITGVK